MYQNKRGLWGLISRGGNLLIWLEGKNSFEIETCDNIGVCASRIRQVLYENRPYLNPRVGWDKAKRLHKLVRMGNISGDELSNIKG